MKKRLMPFVGLLAATTAFAGVAVFASVNGSVSTSGDLRVSFRAAGIDATMSSADFTATADATANYACVNKGGNKPNASNKRTTVTDTVEGSVRLKAVNGTASGTINLDVPDAANFECPNGQVETLTRVAYNNVKIGSDTLGISKTLGMFKRTLVTPK